MDPTRRDKLINEMESMHNQKDWKAYLQGLIKENDNAVGSAIVKIYDSQQQDEKDSKRSLHYDGVGFNQIDAEFMNDIAFRMKNHCSISRSEFERARWKVMKYWRQLMVMSKKNLKKLKEERDAERPRQLRLPGFEDDAL